MHNPNKYVFACRIPSISDADLVFGQKQKYFRTASIAAFSMNVKSHVKQNKSLSPQLRTFIEVFSQRI